MQQKEKTEAQSSLLAIAITCGAIMLMLQGCSFKRTDDTTKPRLNVTTWDLDVTLFDGDKSGKPKKGG